MAQIRRTAFGTAVTVEAIRHWARLYNLAGVYEGFAVERYSAGVLRIHPGTVLLASGTDIQETAARDVAVAATPTVTSLSLYVRHQHVNLTGGSAAEYLVLANGEESQLDGYDYLKLADFQTSVAGIDANSITVPARISEAQEDLLTKSLVGPLSFGWQAHEMAAFTLTSGSLPAPTLEAGKYHLSDVTAGLDMEAHIPLGLRPAQVLVRARQSPASAPGSLSLSATDNNGMSIPLQAPGKPLQDLDTFTLCAFTIADSASLPGLGSMAVSLQLENADVSALIVTFKPDPRISSTGAGVVPCV